MYIIEFVKYSKYSYKIYRNILHPFFFLHLLSCRKEEKIKLNCIDKINGKNSKHDSACECYLTAITR